MNLLDGKKIRDEILEQIKEKIIRENIYVTLAIILVGDNEASKIYIKNKKMVCEEIGIKFRQFTLPESTKEEEVISLIEKLNKDQDITGIILQSPVPNHINYDRCSGLIDPRKDVDGFTKENIYDLYLGKESLVPCTVKGIIRLLEAYDISLEGKNVCIVGRGKIVGLPLSLALLNRNATVTVAHSKTVNLGEVTKLADILIVAVGIPKLIKKEMVKENAIVVDVGISRIDGKIIGDVEFDAVAPVCRYITKTPGGVGPMTVAMIMENILIAKERLEENG